MNKYLLLLIALCFSMQSFTSSKSQLKTRVEAFMELSVSLTDNSKEEIERIKTFLEPSEDQETTAITLYQIWHRELKTFGKQSKKVGKITFLNNNEMAFVDISITRKIPVKDAKKEGATVKEFFKMKTTWVKSEGRWFQRTKIFAK